MRYKYIVVGKKWRDSCGNTHHTTRIVRVEDGAELRTPRTYDYDEAYVHTAVKKIRDAGWEAADTSYASIGQKVFAVAKWVEKETEL